MMAMRFSRRAFSGWISAGVIGNDARSRAWVLRRSGLGFLSDREDDLEMRLLRLPAGDVRERDVEAGPREQALEGARGEAGVALAIGHRDVALLVRLEREDDDTAARPEDARTLLERALR